jgi:adenylate cyclase
MPTDQDKTIRKLRAILSADVKGYSLLMTDDEAFTIKTLKEYRNIMSDLIKQHNGRVVDSPGDNVLADFASVVDAVTCATEIQKVLKVKNEDLPDNKKLEFRIGVNIGDVVQDGNRIYGNGVNVAARIESLAEPGGVSISRNAYGQIKDKLTVGYEYIGEHEVKNIKDPVRVYKVLMDPDDAGKRIGKKIEQPFKKWIWPLAAAIVILLAIVTWQFYQKTITPEFEPASVEKMAFPLPDKPSIAVLPFDNLSGDSEDEFIADGISESIITALSKTTSMFVIARNSTFTYKGKAVKVQNVAEDLGVQYVLEGSLQKSKDKLRINAQLIDAINGNHLWAEKYDRSMNDLFALQDDITMKIITALNVKLTQGEQATVYAKGTENLEAYLKVLQGMYHFQRANKEANAIAHNFAKEAISLDSSYPAAYLLLSRTQMRKVLLGTTKPRKMLLKQSIENVQKAISIDDNFADAHALLGFLYTMIRQHEKGIAVAEAALDLNPNSAEANSYLGLTLNYAGRHEEAIKIYNKAIRLSPIPSANTLFYLCVACRDCGRYKEGISAAKKAIHLEPDYLWAHLCLASCYALLGRDAEAKSESAEVMRIDPKFSVTNLEKQVPYKDTVDTGLIFGSLRKAGLPE